VVARFSAPFLTGPEAHPTSCTLDTESFPGVRCGRGVTLTPHPLLVPRSKTEYSYTCSPQGSSWPMKGRNLPSKLKHKCTNYLIYYLKSVLIIDIKTLSYFHSSYVFRHITCHPQGALMFLAKITGKTICKT
jgi:hypothetical protein